MRLVREPPPHMSIGVRQTVGRLILDLDLMLADGHDPNVRRDTLVHMIIALAGHLCRTEGFQETSLLYAVVAEVAHNRRALSPEDMPQILRAWHERLLAEGRDATALPDVFNIPRLRDAPAPSVRPAAHRHHKPKISLLGRELARELARGRR